MRSHLKSLYSVLTKSCLVTFSLAFPSQLRTVPIVGVVEGSDFNSLDTFRVSFNVIPCIVVLRHKRSCFIALTYLINKQL